MISENDRILITGGAGLVGSHIADLLVRDYNPEIIILDNFVRGQRENLRWAAGRGRVEIVEGDIRDASLIHQVMEGVDIVFHQAAIRTAQCFEDPRLALEVLGGGTFNVLEAAALNRVRKVIAASSAAVYGIADEFPTPETHHPYNNRTVFGAAKTFNEGLFRSFYDMFGLKYVALRYFNVYGPRMDMTGAYTDVLIRWMDRLAAGQPCVISGDGLRTIDFVYVEDVARANVIAANSDVTDDVFNIGSGTEISLRELAAALGRVMGSSIEAVQGPDRKLSPVRRMLASTKRAEHILGFRAEVPLGEGLGRLVTWWERQRALYAAIA